MIRRMGIRHAGFRALLLVLAASPAAATAQDIPVSGAEVRLLQKTSGLLRVIVENTQDSPLTAVHLVLSPARGVVTHAVNFDAGLARASGARSTSTCVRWRTCL